MFFIGYKIKRVIRYMAKEELFRIPFVSFFIAKCGAFPVKRGTGDIGAIRTALKLLEEGHVIGIYPEGTRTKDRKDVSAKPGPVLLAKKSNAPVLPVKIEKKDGLFGEVKVIFGDLYYIDFEKGKKYSSIELARLSQEILDKVYALSGDE
jgi:1-acyl-sn-glycerol-3-phosphate acyltransferase